MKLTIIGAGPGGYETALAAAKKGIDVTLVSAGPLGGTCLNEGCIPTKALCRTAEILENCREAAAFGIRTGEPALDFGQVMRRKQEVVEQLRAGVAFLMKNKFITLLYGKASFINGTTVRVACDDGSLVVVASDAILVATGSVSASLPIPGADLEGVLTSTDLLSIGSVPDRLCIIGAGVIGLEFASIFRSFGSEVHVLEYCKEVLPRFDTDLAKRLKQSLSKRGICIDTSAEVKSVSRREDGTMEVVFVKKEQTSSVVADKVLMAVGRRPAIESMNFDDIGVDWTRRGVTVNGYMQTSVPTVYAIGDITGGMMLAHTAIFQGLRALNHLLAGQPAEGPVDSIDLSIVPAAVFTAPEAAMVGKTEDECKAEGRGVICRKSFFRANGKAVSMGETDGFCKIVADETDGRILGCHLFGAHAADLVHEIAAWMNKGATLGDMASMVHAHPTLAEVLQSAVHE